MDLGNVTLNVLNEGIASKGKVAIYDVYFDTGKSQVRNESAGALKVIAEYLKNNSEKRFLIVGHTDNIGDFNANIQLSQDRATAVIARLVADQGISSEQLKPWGVGSTSPQASNASEEGAGKK